MAGDYTFGGGYKINDIYQPLAFTPGKDSPYLGQSNLISSGQMGITVNPTVVNQLAELSKALNQGVIPIEVGTLNPEHFENIPKEHFHEMRRKAQLAGAKVSLHAPVQGIDPAGFGQKGWDADQQKLVENQLKDVVEKAGYIDPKNNMPVTIHGSNYHGSTWKFKIDEETGKRKKDYDTLIAVDKETGEARPVRESRQFSPEFNEKGEVIEDVSSPEKMLKAANATQWRKEVDQVIYQNKSADKILANVHPQLTHYLQAVKRDPDQINYLEPEHQKAVMDLQVAEAYLQDASLGVNSLFDKAYRHANDENKKKLEDAIKRFQKNQMLGYTEEKLRSLPEHEQMDAITKINSLNTQSRAIQLFAEDIRKANPNMLVPVEEFATKKAAETFANVALHSYDKYKEGAPVISIENLDQGRFGFSQGEDLKKLVIASREEFEKKAVEQGKMSKAKAKEMAEKLIGVTFDVGHLNISKKFGYTDEDLVKEAEKVKEYVKHVHLTDNFGYADVHLPIGMGNVPVKELLEALGDEGKRARKINEVGGWINAFGTMPYAQLLEAAGSPIYSSGEGTTWAGAAGFQQSYLEGYGQMLPSTHYEMFGAGFSSLPKELGGQRGQSGGRMGGGF